MLVSETVSDIPQTPTLTTQERTDMTTSTDSGMHTTPTTEDFGTTSEALTSTAVLSSSTELETTAITLQSTHQSTDGM